MAYILQICNISIIVVALLAIYHNGVLADLENAYYKKSSVRSNVLPVSDLDVLDGRFTRVKCASLCREATLCQTFFYKSDDKQCSLYNYPLLENTPVYANTGVAVYETIGCPNSDFVYFGEAGICLKYFSSTTDLYTDASAVCQQEGGEMISLDTNKKIDALAFYISHYFGFSFGSVSIGLRSTPGWTWSNGEPMSVSHAHVKNSINNYDGAMNPCSHNFCGVLNVVSTVDLELFDNCCNNIPRSFVCSTESLK